MYRIKGYFFYHNQKKEIPEQLIKNPEDLNESFESLGIKYYFYLRQNLEEVDDNEEAQDDNK